MADRAEMEANWFAMAFLMPKTAFKASWKKHGGNLRRVAEEFKVLQQHAETRARQLGLITDGKEKDERDAALNERG